MSHPISFDVIVTASLIPSHPSIKTIRQTIESLHFLNYRGSQRINVFLAHDFASDPKYEQYFKNLERYCKQYNTTSLFHLIVVRRKTHGHLVGNVRNALTHTTQEYLLIIQHDFPFCKHFDIHTVLQDMEERPELKHVRFNKRKNYKGKWDADDRLCWNNHNVRGKNHYISTLCWSDNNHLTRKSYYDNTVMQKSKDGGAMEHYMNGNVHYGTYVFGTIGESKYIHHTDGREVVAQVAKVVAVVAVVAATIATVATVATVALALRHAKALRKSSLT